MKEVIITDKEKLVELLHWSLESAGILNTEVEKMSQAIAKNINKKNFTDYEEAIAETNKALADFILERYDAVVVNSDEQVFGRSGGKDEPIFDGRDTKVFMDARTL